MATLKSKIFAFGVLIFILIVFLAYWLSNISNAYLVVQLLQKISGNYNQISVYKFPFSLLFRSDNNSRIEYKVARIDYIDNDNEILMLTVEQKQSSITIPIKKVVDQEIVFFRKKNELSTAWKNIDLKVNSKLSDIFCVGDLIQFKVEYGSSNIYSFSSRENPVTLYLLRQSEGCSKNNI